MIQSAVDSQALKQLLMDCIVIQPRVVVPQTFLHELARARKQLRTGKHPRFLGHPPRLTHLGEHHPAGIAGDPILHARNLAPRKALDQKMLSREAAFHHGRDERPLVRLISGKREPRMNADERGCGSVSSIREFRAIRGSHVS
ncbi:MAG: hypothetical protein FJ385_08840 [Verrucomicrobia bacterium]|nr:hypothetical protein [Verrucomicrobiota bacterium]